MRAGPETATLIDLARETLADEILPRLSGETRYQALMIMSALAIAQREVADAGRSERHAKTAVQMVLTEALSNAPHRLSSPTTDAADKEIVRHIRAGAFDEPRLWCRLHHALVEANELRLGLTNPALLTRRPRQEGV